VQPADDDTVVYVGDEVQSGSTVKISACVTCYCGEFGFFNCQKADRRWTDDDKPCVEHVCTKGVLTTKELTDNNCDCAHDKKMVTDTENGCCKCIPIKTPPTSGCSLYTSLEQLRVFDDQRKECVSKTNVTITECRGACSSSDESPVRFADRAQLYTKHSKECTCCSGQGRWVKQEVVCSGHKSRTIEVMVYDSCSCETCAESGRKRR